MLHLLCKCCFYGREAKLPALRHTHMWGRTAYGVWTSTALALFASLALLLVLMLQECRNRVLEVRQDCKHPDIYGWNLSTFSFRVVIGTKFRYPVREVLCVCLCQVVLLFSVFVMCSFSLL